MGVSPPAETHEGRDISTRTAGREQAGETWGSLWGGSKKLGCPDSWPGLHRLLKKMYLLSALLPGQSQSPSSPRGEYSTKNLTINYFNFKILCILPEPKIFWLTLLLAEITRLSRN